MTEAPHDGITSAHARLAQRLELAATAMADRVGHREIVQKADAFLVNTCRHTAAVCDLLLPEARRHLPDGPARVQAYVEQCRRMERAFVRTKQRLYGEAHVVMVPWTEVWATAIAEFRALHALEAALVADLAATPGAGLGALAARIEAATGHAPTRPHPNWPHTGAVSHVLRGLWARADRFWDAAEGRIVTDRPQPARTTDLAS